MGLDMYLKGKRYLSNHIEQDRDIAVKIQSMLPELAGRNDEFGGSPIQEITADIGYWRKANAIHGWFVTNIQGGEDQCEPYDVNREQLEALASLCRRVLAFKHLANELLPSTPGFFFGGQHYDEGYFRDLEHTITVIDRALSLPVGWDFVYQSSW